MIVPNKMWYMTKKTTEKTYSYSILMLLHNSHVALYFGWQLLEHFRYLYGLLVSVLHRLTQFLLNKTKGFNTSLFVSMKAFVWCAVHSNQLVLFLKCNRGVLKATQMTLLAFKRNACHPNAASCQDSASQLKHKTVAAHQTEQSNKPIALYESGYLWENTKSICRGYRMSLWTNDSHVFLPAC